MDIIARSLAIQNAKELVNNQLYCIKRTNYRYEIWQRHFGNQWVVYEVWRNIDATINKDSWRIYKSRTTTIKEQSPLSSQTESGAIQLTNEGAQWEYAIQLDGAPDFFGGFHGDENVQDMLIIVDGKPTKIENLISTAFNRFEMVQHTKCFNPIDSTEVGDMYVRHIWTNEGLHLKFRFVWSASQTVVVAYAAMLPALRGNTTSTKCRFIDKPTIYDISMSPHSRPGADSYGMELWNDSNNIGMAVEFDNLDWFNGYMNSNGRGIWVTDNVNYNKIYPTRVFSDARFAETVAPGDVWKASARYRIFCRQ